MSLVVSSGSLQESSVQHAPASETKEIRSLTSVRFFIGFWVMWYHSADHYVPTLSGFVRKFTTAGYLGVSFLFVLSGFLLGYSAFTKDRRIEAKRFWISRFSRLYPLYALGLILSFPLFLRFMLMEASAEQIRWELPTALLAPFGLQSLLTSPAPFWFVPGWSVSTILFFSLVFPFCVEPIRNASNRALWLSFVALWIVSLVPGALWLYCAPSEWSVHGPLGGFDISFLRGFPAFRFPEFLAGLISARLMLRQNKRERAGALLFLVGASGTATLIAAVNFIPYVVLHQGLATPLLAAMIAGLAIGGWPSRLMEWSLFRNLGKTGYSLFILHFPLLAWCDIAFARTGISNEPMRLTIYLLLSIAFGAFGYACIEQPVRKVVSGWLTRLVLESESAPKRPTARAGASQSILSSPELPAKTVGERL